MKQEMERQRHHSIFYRLDADVQPCQSTEGSSSTKKTNDIKQDQTLLSLASVPTVPEPQLLLITLIITVKNKNSFPNQCAYNYW